jgi:NAD(P)-dependent dehydrogenase (short-subunit alcohol dehydrogenase family)
MAGRLKDKVAIVTGAGSRGPGIGNGKAAAILFAREGAKVLCVDADLSRAQETFLQIENESGTAEAFAADVVRAADCNAMVERAATRWGGLDILHNNVGVESRHDLLETTEQEWDRVMAIDLKSMLLTTQAAVPAMEQRGGGAITCVSSIAALVGHGRTAYAAAKAGGAEARERRKRATPLGTEGNGWDVGWGAVYLASDEARWVSGHILVIDAGLTLTTR